MKNFTKVVFLVLCVAVPSLVQAQVSGTVFRDFNGNGVKDNTATFNEPFLAGVTVKAYSAADVLLATATTNAAGAYSFTGLTLPLRIEFTGFPPGYYTGPKGTGNATTVQFYSASSTTANLGVNYPDEYSASSPLIGAITHTRAALSATPLQSIKTFPWGNTGSTNTGMNSLTSPVNPSTGFAAGALWGLAYSPDQDRIYTSAFMRRFIQFGTNGTGAIYVTTNVKTPASSATSLFINLNGMVVNNAAGGTTTINTGTNPHSTDLTTDLIVGANNPFDAVGKISFGDMDISEDKKYLYVVSLNDKKLYRITIDADNNIATNPVAADVLAYDLPAGSCSSGQSRPFGLGMRNGKVYVGIICDAGSATLTPAPTATNFAGTNLLTATIYSLSGSTFTSEVSFPLNYYMGFPSGGEFNQQRDHYWRPWISTWTSTFPYTQTSGIIAYPQPILTDIQFDIDGSMIVGITDRFSMQGARDVVNANNSQGANTYEARGGGDIRRICNTGTLYAPVYTVEGGGGCTQTTNSAVTSYPNAQPIESEFYTGDVYNTGANPSHTEISYGALALLPGSGNIAMTAFDPISQANSGAVFTNGIRYLSNTNGSDQNGYDLTFNASQIGKSCSMGDIELLTAAAPIELGNRIWNDANGDGIQNPGEAGISGVTLELVDANGNAVDSDPATAGVQATTVTTDANGNWYITSATGTDATGINYGVALLPNTTYQIRLASGASDDWDPTAFGGQGGPRAGQQLVGLGLTKTNKIGNGQPGLSDNDASMISSIPTVIFTTGGYGQNNHTIDFGFKPLATIGDKVWRDDNKNATQDAGEPGISGITITLFRPGFGLDGIASTADDALPIGNTVTDSYGNYLFDNLTPGNYQVQVNLPANYQFTTQSNTVDNTDGAVTRDKGSDVNATTGLSYTVALSAGENERNIDAGLIFNQPAAVSSIGDKVWYDTNGNGTQDAGEPGTSNVTVTLYKETAPGSGIYTVYATTVTDVNGLYLFNNLPNNTNYKVGITAPAGTQLTSSTGTTAGNATTDSDLDPVTRLSAVVNIPVAGAQITGIDAGLILQPTTKASIGDRVWYDNNRDGDQDAGEPGIAGVTVQLMDGSSNVLATTTTDAFGNYIFTNLNPGLYRVNFGAVAGMQRTAMNATGGTIADITDSDADPTTGKTQGYTLNAGGKNMSVDAGYYSTQPAANVGAIGDRVWMDNDGNGVQDPGEPSVAGVTVTLYDNAGTAIATATTDINGNYLFPGLTPGNYSVGFSNLPAGFGFSGQFKGGNTATDGDANPATGRTQTVVVTGGTTNITVDAGIRQGLPSGLGSLGDRVFLDLPGGVTGQQDAGELGVANVIVQLYLDANGDGSITGAEQTAIASTTTNALGEYLFAGLSAGTYQVGFSNLPASYTLTVKDAAGISDDEDSDGNPVNTAVSGNPAVAGKSYTDLISLAQGEDNLSVDLGLATPANTNSLGNFVWFDANSNGIQDAAETGVPGVMVTLYNNAGTAIAVTTTDGDGQYLFTGLADGNYSVGFVNYPGGFDLTTKSATNDLTGSDADRITGRTATVTLNFAAGGTNRDNRSLDAGLVTTRAALGDKVWSDLNNNGTQDGGEYGIPGVTVSLFRPGFGLDGVAGNGDDALPVASMITDGKGNYFFSNLAPGDYQLEFTTIPAGMLFTQQNTPGDNQNNTNSDAVPANANGRTGTITLSAGETDLTVDAGLTVPRPATIGNFVWDDFNANGIQDATEPGIGGILVTLYNSLNAPVGSAVTDGNGKWQITNIPAGTGYYVIFSPNLPSFNTTATPGSNPAWTTQNLGANGTGAIDSGSESDVDSDVTTTGASAGRTAAFNIVSGNNFPNIDAGIVNWASGNVLPIQLVSFVAQPQNNRVQLNWVVASEVNVSRYEILYSTNGTNFISIGTQPATHSSNYSQMHTSPQQGLNYYRLKIIDIDGSVSYSEIRKVNFGKAGDMVSLYPVPANAFVNITVTAGMTGKPAIIRLFSVDGSLMLQQNITAFSQTETINVSKLAAGKYILSMYINNETVNRQIEIVR